MDLAKGSHPTTDLLQSVSLFPIANASHSSSVGSVVLMIWRTAASLKKWCHSRDESKGVPRFAPSSNDRLCTVPKGTAIS
jgi:hypothetical protein